MCGSFKNAFLPLRSLLLLLWKDTKERLGYHTKNYRISF